MSISIYSISLKNTHYDCCVINLVNYAKYLVNVVEIACPLNVMQV